MSNSPLATRCLISPHRTSPRNHVIDTITIHCYVGQVTAQQGLDGFHKPSKGASCNYVIGRDGEIGLCVEEADRSWCTGGKDEDGNPIYVNGISGAINDHRAITIEVASDNYHPYAVTDAAYDSLIRLLTDICRRNNIKQLLWRGDKSLVGNVNLQNLTVHRWFARKSCPGDYLYNKHREIAVEVNRRLGLSEPATPAKDEIYRVRTSWEDSKSQIGAYRNLDSAKAVADENPGYAVYNSAGEAVYRTTASGVEYRVQVVVSDLNIRTGPGTTYDKNGFTGQGIFTIVDTRSGAGSAAGWGKLKSGAGWISLDYATRL